MTVLDPSSDPAILHYHDGYKNAMPGLDPILRGPHVKKSPKALDHVVELVAYRVDSSSEHVRMVPAYGLHER